jgi:hypothetical protein
VEVRQPRCIGGRERVGSNGVDRDAAVITAVTVSASAECDYAEMGCRRGRRRVPNARRRAEAVHKQNRFNCALLAVGDLFPIDGETRHDHRFAEESTAASRLPP